MHVKKVYSATLEVRHFAATAQLNMKNGGIWILYCPPQYRRRGYAKGLMTSIIKFAKEQGIKTLWLTAGGFRDAEMTHAQLRNFYKRFGFKHTDSYKEYGCEMKLTVN